MERCAVVPYEGTRNYIFISYSHRDSKLVYPILERLSREGYRLWYDDGIDPGSEWPESIADHLGRASSCIAMISNNYLASDNCRRELNFALKRQIPLLSILLEDAEMSAGVEMQLSTNQAIFKHLLPSDEVFVVKVNGTKILQSSREIIEKKPAKAVEAAPAPSVPPVAPASAPSVPPVAPVSAPSVPPVAPVSAPSVPPVAPVSAPSAPSVAPAPKARKDRQKKAETDAKKPETGTKKPMSKKKWLYASIAAAAVIAIVAVAVIVIGGSGTSGKSTKSSSQAISRSETVAVTEPPVEVNVMEAPDAPISYNDFLNTSPYAGRVLWGKKVVVDYADKDEFVQESNFVDVALEGGTVNISKRPYAIEVRKDDHPEVVRLYFLDKLGTEHIVQGAYAIRDHNLIISPCDAVFQDARPLAEELTYSIYISGGKISLDYLSYCSEEVALSGAADNAVVKEISALEILSPEVGADCAVLFTDGGHANDVTVSGIDGSYLTLRWSQENRLYNGVMADFDVDKEQSYSFVNTYPYGFILFYSFDVYFYQQPFPTNAD